MKEGDTSNLKCFSNVSYFQRMQWQRSLQPFGRSVTKMTYLYKQLFFWFTTPHLSLSIEIPLLNLKQTSSYSQQFILGTTKLGNNMEIDSWNLIRYLLYLAGLSKQSQYLFYNVSKGGFSSHDLIDNFDLYLSSRKYLIKTAKWPYFLF